MRDEITSTENESTPEFDRYGMKVYPPGSYKLARGVIPWQPGDEPAEVSIRRSRGDMSDLEARIADLEARLAALEKRLDESEGGK